MFNNLDTLLIKVASRCNLDCSYCYVYQGQDQNWVNQPKRISNETIDSICKSIDQVTSFQNNGFAVVLHGGEPLLLGSVKLKELLSKLRRVLPNYDKYPIAIQTNGILLSDEIIEICSHHKTSISVSLDGVKKSNDIARFTHDGQSSFQKVINGINKLNVHPDKDFLFSGTLSVIQPTTSPIENYEYLKSIGSKSIDVLLQDGNHTYLPKNKENFESLEYGMWLGELLEYYLNDTNPVPIRFFDDLIKIILGGNPDKEGKGQNSYGILVIETNGDIRKNDTLRATFNGADYFENSPNINIPNALLDILKSDEYKEASKIQKLTCEECINCEINFICGGGMPLSRWSKEKKFNNPSIYCHDHKHYIYKLLDLMGIK